LLISKRTTRSAAALLLCSTWAAAAASAQAESAAAPGDRVRVRPKHGKRITGAIVSLDEYRLQLQPIDARESIALDWNDVRRVEVSRGRHGHARTGAIVGGLLVGVPGALVGSLCNFYGESSESCAGAIVYEGAVGALLGGAVGAGIGSAFRSERWDTVSRPRRQLSLAITPRRGGVAATVGVRF
jgi:hypothetical protein